MPIQRFMVNQAIIDFWKSCNGKRKIPSNGNNEKRQKYPKHKHSIAQYN